jgi:hypothetical protein
MKRFEFGSRVHSSSGTIIWDSTVGADSGASNDEGGTIQANKLSDPRSYFASFQMFIGRSCSANDDTAFHLNLLTWKQDDKGIEFYVGKVDEKHGDAFCERSEDLNEQTTVTDTVATTQNCPAEGDEEVSGPARPKPLPRLSALSHLLWMLQVENVFSPLAG